MKEIPLSQGKVAVVDDVDFEEIGRYKWHATKRPHTWYAVRNSAVNGKKTIVYMHRVLMPDAKNVDHIDHNGLNNTRSNLRNATDGENQANRLISKSSGKTSKYKGVYWHKASRKWMSRICIGRKTRYLGLYTSEDEAAHAYDRAAVAEFSHFALTNLPVPQETTKADAERRKKIAARQRAKMENRRADVGNGG